MRVVIVGGGLQGVEAVYLAQKAGWVVTLLDKNSDCPAAGLCDQFIRTNVTAQDFSPLLDNKIDLIIPALEDDVALNALLAWTRKRAIPFAFDAGAYSVSSSKAISKKLFSRLHIPIPEAWPHGKYPMIVKPSKSSGSKGIKILEHPAAMEASIPLLVASEDIVVEEFIKGPSYSLEIFGVAGRYVPLQVTDLSMDKNLDCMRVVAPTCASQDFVAQFKKIAVQIAAALSLKGIMDVEVILHEGKLFVIEIDARLPSQTPTVVYWSSGLNMLEILRNVFFKGHIGMNEETKSQRGVVYQHIHVGKGVLKVGGEHLVANAGPLHIWTNFFGADEAITNYQEGKDEWVATLIISGADREDALEKKNTIQNSICQYFNLRFPIEETHYLLR